MKITCPDCNTSYGIKPEALGPEGRSVKCAKCGNRWFVSPKDEDKDTAAFEADAAEDDSPGKPADDNKTDSAKDEEDWAADADAGADDQDDFAAEDDPEPVADVKPPIRTHRRPRLRPALKNQPQKQHQTPIPNPQISRHWQSGPRSSSIRTSSGPIELAQSLIGSCGGIIGALEVSCCSAERLP